MHLEILDPNRRKIFAQLGFTRKLNLYLAGGTALALHLGHRTSVDFDFYSSEQFKRGTLRVPFEEQFAVYSKKVIRDYDDTFEIEVENIHMSCFFYQYPLIRPLVLIENVQIASVEDIAAMKIVAIAQRGNYRDFIDIYYLIQKFTLARVLKLAEGKYPSFDIYSGLRGLVYFEDAEKDTEKERIQIFDPTLTWSRVKKHIQDQVISYQRSFIRE